jgi:GLPGLI family protein
MSVAWSCGKETNPNAITSGRIDYKISYLNKDLDKKTLEILPKKMKLVFTEKEAINNIEGLMGFVKLESLTNFHTHKCSTVLKVFNKNYLYKGKHNEMMCCFSPMDEMEITSTDETKVIAGLNCHKAIVHFPGDTMTFNIFYTGDITLKHPNSTNPYHEIDGVLMEFEMFMLNLHMRLTAEKFISDSSKKDNFDLPESTQDITREQMTGILARLMN